MSTKLTIIVSANILVLLLALGIIAVVVVVAVSNFSVGQALAQTSLSSSPISTAKMHIDEGIKALQNGDTKGALKHLNAADKSLTEIHIPAPVLSAKMHIDEGIKALHNGDTKGALTHLNIADKVFGSIVQ